MGADNHPTVVPKGEQPDTVDVELLVPDGWTSPVVYVVTDTYRDYGHVNTRIVGVYTDPEEAEDAGSRTSTVRPFSLTE